MTVVGHRIAGVVDDRGDPSIPLLDPAAGVQVGEVAQAGAGTVAAAVAAAVDAFPAWRDLSVSRRQRVLFGYRQILLDRVNELARVIAAEHGKTLDDARGEIARGTEVVEYVCGLPELLKGEHSQQVSTGIDIHSVRHPLGVCVGITPFNFPAMVPLWMFPIAIAAGNTFVLKPSERDPSASLLLAAWFEEAGLPAGVLNVVQGGADAVQGLLKHPQVRAASFVGSTPVAQVVYETGARHGKRVQALGGAKNHLVVLPDADLEAAADAVVSAGYGSAGQRCMAVSVLVCVDDVADRLLPLVADRTTRLRVGRGTDDVDLGPMITAAARDRAVAILEQGERAGAEVVVDGRDLVHRDGFFLGPCLVDRVTPEMGLYHEEIFGPVLATMRVDSLAAALELVADNPYGNGASLFTADGAAARQFEQRVESGMVGINVPIPVPMSAYSFGGWNNSLFGSAHIYGPEGIAFYTRGKIVTSRWTPNAKRPDLGFKPAP